MTASDPSRDWLLATIRLPVGAHAPTLPLTCSVERLFALAQKEGVVGLVDERLRAATNVEGQAPEGRMVFAAGARRLAAMGLWQSTETVRLVEALEAAGLRVLVLKGTALGAWLYSAPHLRAGGDLDLLFASRQDAESAALILAAHGYPDGHAQGGLAYEMLRKPASGASYALELDIHWRLLNAPVFAERLPFEALWAGSIPIPALSPRVRGLGPVHALLHAAMNRAVNLYVGTGEVLKCLYDVHLLSALFDEAGWERVVRLAEETGLCGVLHAALGASQRLLGTQVSHAVHAALLRRIPEEGLDPERLGDWAYMQRRSIEALPGRQRLRWLWGRLVPDTDYLRSVHGADVPLPALFVAHYGRLVRRLFRSPPPPPPPGPGG